MLGAYFSKHRPSPQAVSEYVLALHQKGQYEYVIATIESALVHGQSQPWMYETLALSMELAGRPQAQVERVLLSQVDFTAVDVPSMLYSAAYLTRFDAHAAALRLYRQASRIDPTRPEPYALGLKLARQQKDYEAIRWAAAGILATAWTSDHTELHRQAENAAAEAEQQLRQAGRDDEAAAFAAAMKEARQRDLIVRIEWSGNGDLDLFVEEPPGTVCSYETPRTTGGGVLVHDGFGPDSKNCFDEYVCAQGVAGTYRVKIVHSLGNIVGKRAQVTIIRYQGTANESVQTFAVPLEKDGTTVRLSLEKGRRTGLAAVMHVDTVAMPAVRRSRPSLLQMVGGLDRESRLAGVRFDQSRQRILPARGAGGTTTTVGYQPLVSVLSEGATLSALAVVSGDRRYVRISTAPAITAITDVFTFTFQGGGANTGQGGGNAGGAAAGN